VLLPSFFSSQWQTKGRCPLGPRPLLAEMGNEGGGQALGFRPSVTGVPGPTQPRTGVVNRLPGIGFGPHPACPFSAFPLRGQTVRATQ
jgi:hypothetical protein